jgi:two-component system, cell cycle response regulator
MTWWRTLRRMAKVSAGTATGAVVTVAVALGIVDRSALLRPGHDATTTLAAIAFCFIAGVLLTTLIRRVQYVAPTARAQRASIWLAAATDFADIELSLSLVAAMYAVIAVTGQHESIAYPLLYGCIGFAVTTMARPGAIAIVGSALFAETAAFVRTGALPNARIALVVHVVMIIGAAFAHAIMLRGLVARYRRRRNRKIDEEISALRESARDYRLIAAALGPASRAPRNRDEEERLLAMGGVGMIADAAHWSLTTVKRSLSARTVAVLWLAEDGESVRLREVVSDSDDIAENNRLASAGILGAVIRDRNPLICATTKAGQLPYYTGDRGGSALIAVPVMELGHLRGVLCADRNSTFCEADKTLLVDAAAQLMRAVQSEQVFRAVERAKYEHERFYAAAILLGKTLTPEQVMETAFDAARAIVEFDAGVITLYDRETHRHKVSATRVVDNAAAMFDQQQVIDLEFKDNAGLVSMVVKNRHYLPATGELRDVSVPVFNKKIDLSGVKSLLVLPLLSADEPIGTITLLAKTEKRFGKDVREMLSVIANQVATSLQNGFLYRKMETMATTDGLTGLTNHRTFQQKFADLLDRADRHGYRVAMLLCDVDHFKKVNDNYGHPIGDEVLRRVARVLQEVPRKIDVPARYGGEEFAVLLDNVSVEQARAVAERIRIEVSKLVVETEKGPLQVTQSIGIALFPDDGRDRATLIERADLALYHAKHTGRNRVVSHTEFVAARAAAAGTPAEIAQKAS